MERQGLSLVLPVSESPGTQPTLPGCLGSRSRWAFLPPAQPPGRPLPPRPAPLTLQAGVRDLLHILLHEAPLAARHLAAQVPLHALPGCRKQGWSGALDPQACSIRQSGPVSVQAGGHPLLTFPPNQSGPAGPLPPTPASQLLAPWPSLLLTCCPQHIPIPSGSPAQTMPLSASWYHDQSCSHSGI